jgi:hypothetical protein
MHLQIDFFNAGLETSVAFSRGSPQVQWGWMRASADAQAAGVDNRRQLM